MREIRPLFLRGVIAILIGLAGSSSAHAAIIYSGLRDIAIPTNFDGIYLDIETGVTSSAEFWGWDINPFFGGVGVATSPSLLPVRIGEGNEDAIVRHNAGSVIHGSLTYAVDVGHGGSFISHMGSGSGQFGVGDEGYLAFRFITNDGLQTNFGWMRVVFTANTSGALIKDWAYEDSGSSVVTGRVHQSPASGGVKLTTLSPGAGEAFSLGSPVSDPGSGDVGSLLKIGVGTTVLAAPHTFSGATTINAGKLTLIDGGSLSATASVTVNTGGTLLFGGAGGVNAKLNSAAALNLGGGTVSAAAVESSLDQQLGVLTLTENSKIDFGTFAGGHTFRLADSSAAAWTASRTLNLWNWTPGLDHLFVGLNSAGLTAGQLSQVRFFSDNGLTLLGSGFYGSLGEVIVPVPEPGSHVAALGLLVLIGFRENRKARKHPASHRAAVGFWSRAGGAIPGCRVQS